MTDIQVQYDKLDSLNNCTLLMNCPGYNENNFLVTMINKKVVVRVVDGVSDIKYAYHMVFNLNDSFPVEDISYKVVDGIFKLQVKYDLGTFVKRKHVIKQNKFDSITPGQEEVKKIIEINF